MRVQHIELMHLKIPFKIAFRHFLAERNYNDTLIARVTFSDGTIGHGEGIPREYLNKETITASLSNRHILRFLMHKEINLELLADFTKVHARAKKYNALLSAVELAVLDAYCRSEKKSFTTIIGNVKHKAIQYSGIISADSILKVVALAYTFRRRGVKQIKIKVGTKNDEKRIRLVRKIMGEKADIRLDANCAWTAQQAIEKIQNFKRYNISAVEQPVKADDYAGLRAIRKAISIPVIADESLINLDDAEKLLDCVGIYNIRISKCGGLFNSLGIYDFARKHKKKVMLGCQVGETGILTAAGRAMAGCLDFRYVEGSYNKFLLKQDIVKEDVTVKNDFTAPALKGHGLGITVKPELLRKFAIKRVVL